MSTTLMSATTRSDISSMKTPEQQTGELGLKQTIENALRKVHEMLSASASQTDYHREMMTILSTSSHAQLTSVSLPSPPPTPGGYPSPSTSKSSSPHKETRSDKAAAQPNKDSPASICTADTNSVQDSITAEVLSKLKPKLKTKKRREFNPFRKDIRMGIRGDAPINKPRLSPLHNPTAPHKSFTRPAAAPVSTTATEQPPQDAEAIAEAARERKALKALQEASHAAATAAPRATIVESVPEYVADKLKDMLKRDVRARQYANWRRMPMEAMWRAGMRDGLGEHKRSREDDDGGASSRKASRS
ncbi:hypothetical protein K458DRAFT_406554 [Lentithecium fluviatile CBS 122367]|uniref:Uncharacterized protein n=1 Tax=Lentithecium fluviatile CBS 122367 TaxID=1168545 RepID=A0A6G1ISE8_9PLEO|nr:hypothetical protein K458DRAFT_406554 [Lentithecium fluviatile CBS 122367]